MQENRTKFRRTCRCGVEFETSKPKQIYCCAACRYRAYRNSRVEITVAEFKEYQWLREIAASAGLIGFSAGIEDQTSSTIPGREYQSVAQAQDV